MDRKLRIYVDTSVIGGCCDDEFSEWSNRLMGEFRIALHAPVISPMTQAEISRAPRDVQDILLELIDHGCQVISETDESLDLAEEYLRAGILPKTFEDDARHIAVATINNR